MSTPQTRTLATVLSTALQPGAGLRLLLGTCATGGTSTYLEVTVEGATIKVPKLKGVTVNPGEPVYLLAAGDFLLALGTVSA